jgi:hypothetical protein
VGATVVTVEPDFGDETADGSLLLICAHSG